MNLSNKDHCITCSINSGEPVNKSNCSSLTHGNTALPRLSRFPLINEACDFCQATPSYLVDAPTVNGPWAHMCVRHYAQHGIGSNGTTHRNLIQEEV